MAGKLGPRKVGEEVEAVKEVEVVREVEVVVDNFTSSLKLVQQHFGLSHQKVVLGR